METTMLVYTILTVVLSAIIAEETRDLRYIPLLATLGFALIGGLVCLTEVGLSTEPSATIVKSTLAIFAILAGFLFFRDLRSINKVHRGAFSCNQGVLDCLSQSMSRLHSSKTVNENSLKTENKAEIAFKTTTESVEGLQHG
jgi:hypothetical protein